MEKSKTEELFLEDFRTFENNLNGQRKIPFHQIRKSALSEFKKLGLPSRKIEEWKYTDISPLLQENLEFRQKDIKIDSKKVTHFLYNSAKEAELVFINSEFSKIFSAIENYSEGIILKNLHEALQTESKLINEHLAKHATVKNEAFTALNTAFTNSGTFIYIPDNVVLKKPISVLNLSVPQQLPHHTHPRILIIVGKNSHLNIIESIHHVGQGSYFNNNVTEIIVNKDATVQHILLQEESAGAFRINNTQISQEPGSTFTSINIDLGGRLVRNNLNIYLGGEHAESNLFGFYLGTGNQHIDNHTKINHAFPYCNSNQLYKGILSDKSRGVFSGTIHVHPDAQKTNAFQSNKNLLLSDEAEIDSKPQLKIFADDVKCSHGATIGQMEESAIFYLQQRGISLDQAQFILRNAFAGEVLEKIPYEAVKEKVLNTINQKLSKTN
jgi:Fe-S cluster assembly protein SufD